MRCERVQLGLSAAMDGDRRDLTAAMTEHASTCVACTRFERAAQRTRTATRLRVAEPVPDLVPLIMERVREEAANPRVVTLPSPKRARSTVRTALVAAVIGALVGAAVVGGGLLGRRPDRALAARIPQAIAVAAATMDGYEASYRVVERGWDPGVPRRTFDVDVAFAAPERFRVDVHDTTSYPDGTWPRNDSSLRVDADRWSLTGPDTCASVDVVTCAQTRGDRSLTTTISGRPPFDADAPMPTDIVLPVVSLAGTTDRVDVVGRESVDGRDAVVLEMDGQDAEPLFSFFQQAGSWRPVYATDHVRLWLDERTWVPLRFEVRAAGGEDRAVWASRNGIRDERPGDLMLDVRLTRFSLDAPPASDFAVGEGGESEGFRDVPTGRLASVAGFEPLEPSTLLGLAPYRSGVFEGVDGSVMLSYADGLRWLRLRETRRENLPPLSPFAQRVDLPGGGVGSYLPADAEAGSARSVRISADGWDVVVESNLPRDELLAIAGSLPIRGVAPEGLIAPATPAELSQRAGFNLLAPATLPAGVRLVAAETDHGSARLVYAREGNEPEGFGIRVFESPGTVIPPPTGPSLSTVPIRGTVARWSADRHELEWVEDGVYVSILAPGMDLDAVAALAESMEPAS